MVLDISLSFAIDDVGLEKALLEIEELMGAGSGTVGEQGEHLLSTLVQGTSTPTPSTQISLPTIGQAVAMHWNAHEK